MARHRPFLALLALGATFTLVACTPGQPTPAEATSTPTLTPTPKSQAPGLKATPTATVVMSDLPVATESPPEQEPSACPAQDTVYQLEYVHEVVQDMPQMHLEHIAEPGAAFSFTVHKDRSVGNEGFEDLVSVAISGTFEDCSLEGNGQLSADISGSCAGGIISLQVTEYWESVSTTTTCPGQEPQTVDIAGMFSAPEDRFSLDIQEDGDTRVLEADTGILSVYYSWTLRR